MHISALRCLNFQFKSDQPPLVLSVAKWWNSAPCHGHGHGWMATGSQATPARHLNRSLSASFLDSPYKMSIQALGRSQNLGELGELHVVLWCIDVYCGSMISMWVHYQNYPFHSIPIWWSRWVSDSQGFLAPLAVHWLTSSVGWSLAAEGCPRTRRRSLGFEAALPRPGKALFQAHAVEPYMADGNDNMWQSVVISWKWLLIFIFFWYWS